MARITEREKELRDQVAELEAENEALCEVIDTVYDAVAPEVEETDDQD